jgi:hypothetical protein
MGRPYGIGEACRDLNTGSVPLRYQVGYRPPPYASLRPPVRLPRANNDAAMNTQKGALIRCLRQRVRPPGLNQQRKNLIQKLFTAHFVVQEKHG